MKKIVPLFLLFISLSLFSAAQGSLQFNAVKMVTTSETVPAGKVWKLISAPYKNDVVAVFGGYTSSNPAVESSVNSDRWKHYLCSVGKDIQWK